MRRLSPCQLIRESDEWYIMSAVTHQNNTKIRYEMLDVKQLLRTNKGLEQWRPHLKAEFPLAAAC